MVRYKVPIASRSASMPSWVDVLLEPIHAKQRLKRDGIRLSLVVMSIFKTWGGSSVSGRCEKFDAVVLSWVESLAPGSVPLITEAGGELHRPCRSRRLMGMSAGCKTRSGAARRYEVRRKLPAGETESLSSLGPDISLYLHGSAQRC